MDGRINYWWDSGCLTPYAIMFIMRMRYDEGLDSEEIANYENKHDIIHFRGVVSEDDETYCGCDTITAPDGKEYPIRDRD